MADGKTHAVDGRQRPALVAGLTWAIGVTLVLLWLRSAHWWLSGDDAYYHIRVAAELRAHGVFYFDRLDWTRLSVFSDGWGDKEFLFHVFLMPFAGGDLLSGAKLALSILNGVSAGVLAWIGVLYAGRTGWLVPLLALAMTTALAVRLDQLRPHNLALILLLFIAIAAATRSWYWLLLLGALFALSYTAWHLPVGLCALAFVAFLVLRRERRWELLWAPVIGTAAGILLHPGFPDNTRIWWIQNVQFFLAKNSLNVGTEIYGSGGVAVFALNHWRGAAVIALGTLLIWPWRRHERATDQEITVGVFAATSMALYAGAMRFAEYAIPFLSLYLVILSSRVRVAAPSYPRRLAVLAAALVIGAITSIRNAATVVRVNHARYGFATPADIERFGETLPYGATVASTWDFTPFYYFAAPQASFLNVLDPVYQWIRYPEAHDQIERTFAGDVVDVPGALMGSMHSEYIAYHRDLFPDLALRIERDPRMKRVFESGGHTIARVNTSARAGFVTDWTIHWSQDTTFTSFTLHADADIISPAEYSILPMAALVKPAMSSRDGCWWATRKAPASGNRRIRFGSSGPTSVYIDGVLRYRSATGHGGLIDAVSFETGEPRHAVQQWAVRSCPDPRYSSGFFWRVD